MAVVVESKTDPIYTTNNTVVVTKPTGLSVGDLMLAQWIIGYGNTRNVPTGWTEVFTSRVDNFEQTFLYKIADSSDVNASDFSFTKNQISGAASQSVGILRISGFSYSQPISVYDFEDTKNNSNPTYSTISITPFADSMLIIGIVGDTSVSVTSDYAIATDNPTWTEAWDVVDNTGTERSIALAYANRTQNTATGAVSITYAGDGGSIRTGCSILSIPLSKDVTISETLTLTDTAKQDITLNTSDTLTSTDEIETEKKKVWLNEDKHTSTWTNQDKS